jgi:hypothetical protein
MIEKKDHNICRWKFSSWLGTGTNMYQAVYRRMGSPPSAFLIIGSTMKYRYKQTKKCLLSKKKNKDWLTWSQYNVSDGGFYFHHCLIFLSINTNFIVFGLSQKRIKFMIYHT